MIGLPVLIGAIGKGAEGSRATIADDAAGEISDRLPRLLVAEQKTKD